jgi:hypothetical protein
MSPPPIYLSAPELRMTLSYLHVKTAKRFHQLYASSLLSYAYEAATRTTFHEESVDLYNAR